MPIAYCHIILWFGEVGNFYFIESLIMEMMKWRKCIHLESTIFICRITGIVHLYHIIVT